eukprot:8126808-Pyramimonas_sp.AAC.1
MDPPQFPTSIKRVSADPRESEGSIKRLSADRRRFVGSIQRVFKDREIKRPFGNSRLDYSLGAADAWQQSQRVLRTIGKSDG